MAKVCENPEEDSFHLFSHIDDENLNQNEENDEEQQKILKNIILEFKKNKENKNVKKLYNSSTIKTVPFLRNINRNNKYQINKKVNEDGTIFETKIEKMPNGKEKVIKTRYDANNKVISSKIYYNDTSNNNNINNNNNRNRGNIFKASNGYTIETKIETLPNGKKNEIKIIRDENNIVVDVQEDEIIENNIPNNIPNNINMIPPMNYMGNPNMNNFNPNPPLMPNMNMNMNNNYGINNPINPMNINRNNYNINYMNNMNNMNNMPMPMPMPIPMPMPMPPMMNNYGYPPMGMMIPMPMPIPLRNIGVDPNILNSLPENEVSDSSKLDPDNKNCVICLGDFQDKEHIICLPCIHVFHSECIKSWLSTNNCCPTCKFELTYQNLNAHQQ